MNHYFQFNLFVCLFVASHTYSLTNNIPHYSYNSATAKMANLALPGILEKVLYDSLVFVPPRNPIIDDLLV
jgi:hypothetical protein